MFRTLICGAGTGVVVQLGNCGPAASWSLKSANRKLESFQTKALVLGAIERSGLSGWYELTSYVAKRRGERSDAVKADETLYRMAKFGAPRISKLLAAGNSRAQAAFRILCDDFPEVQHDFGRSHLWALLHPMPINAYDLRVIEEWCYRFSRDKRPAVSPNAVEEFHRCSCLSYGMTGNAYPYLYRLLVELRSAEHDANLLRYACALHALLDATWPATGILKHAVISDIKTYLIRTFGFIKLEVREQTPLTTARYLRSLQIKLVPIQEEPKSSVERQAVYRVAFDFRPPSNCRRTKFVY